MSDFYLQLEEDSKLIRKGIRKERMRVIEIIDNKIKELDEKSFEHCFKRGKMCKECFEKKALLMEVKKELDASVENDGGKQ